MDLNYELINEEFENDKIGNNKFKSVLSFKIRLSFPNIAY